MPLYRLSAPTFIRPAPGRPIGMLPAGTQVEYDGIPGETLEPLDDAARAAKEARPVRRAGLQPLNGKRPDPELAPDMIEIPVDWEDMRPEKIVNLARKLRVAARNCNITQARAGIAKEQARREGAVTENSDE